MNDSTRTPGTRFREALAAEKPLQIAGAIHAQGALLARQAGFKAIYLSGGGVAAGSLGMPDLGLNTLQDVLTDVERITAVCDTPLLVDADTGFGPSALNIGRSIRALAKAGAAACHIEDQVGAKRCGHRPGKEVVATQEMVDRIKAAVDAKPYADFFVMARTDALHSEGIDSALARAAAYVEAGADAIFAEAARDLPTYERFTRELKVPVLANMTEFGVSPLFDLQQLGQAGIAMVLYPLTAFRMMNRAAELAYATLRSQGHQRELLPQMQTRASLYETIGYHAYEQTIDALFERSRPASGEVKA